MITKPILIVAGEPYSIFLEIFFKSLKEKKIKKIKNPIILICSKDLLIKQMKKLKYKFSIRNINKDNFHLIKLNNQRIKVLEKIGDFIKIDDKNNLYKLTIKETYLISDIKGIKKQAWDIISKNLSIKGKYRTYDYDKAKKSSVYLEPIRARIKDED